MNIKHFKYLRVIIITMVIVSTGCEDSNEKIEEKIANTSFIPFKYYDYTYVFKTMKNKIHYKLKFTLFYYLYSILLNII